MNILTYLLSLIILYWSDLLLVVVVVAILAILYKNGKKDLVKNIIKNLVVKAQLVLGSTTGSAKYSKVIKELYESLPLLARVLFTRAELDNCINDTVIWLKDKLQDPDVNLLSYGQEATVNSALLSLTPTDKTVASVPSVVIAAKKYVTEDGIELIPLVTATATEPTNTATIQQTSSTTTAV